MKVFKDKNNREWEININVFQFKRCRDLLSFDLADLTQLFVAKKGHEAMNQIATDVVLFVDILYVLCKDQADKLNITDVDFGQLFDGDVIDKALVAFLEELALFFPQPGRSMLQQLIEKEKKQVQTSLATLSEDKISELLNSVTNTAESSESTQTN